MVSSIGLMWDTVFGKKQAVAVQVIGIGLVGTLLSVMVVLENIVRGPTVWSIIVAVLAIGIIAIMREARPPRKSA